MIITTIPNPVKKERTISRFIFGKLNYKTNILIDSSTFLKLVSKFGKR